MTSDQAQIHSVEIKVRHIFLHYHLFKNAGTSIDQILEKNFGSAFAYLHGRKHDSTVTNEYLLHFLREHPEVRAVSSHHLRPPKPEIEEMVFFEIIFLRHPLDRLRSMYDFYCRSEETVDPLVECAHRLGMAGFIQLLLTSYPHMVNDAQVNYLANGAQYTRPPDERDLHNAIHILTRAAMPGVTEMFDLSMMVARYYLYPAFGSLDLTHAPANVSPGRDKTLDERLSRMKESCGETLYQALVEVNQLDLQLLRKAEAEIRRRFAGIPSVAGASRQASEHNVALGVPR